MADSSELSSTNIMENSYWKDTLLRIQELSMDTVEVDLLNEKPEDKNQRNRYVKIEKRMSFNSGNITWHIL